MPPRRDVMAGRIEEGAEPELGFRSCHDAVPRRRILAPRGELAQALADFDGYAGRNREDADNE